MNARYAALVCVAVASIGAGSRCPAAFIAYQETAVISGTLGGTTFSGATLAIRLDSDTSTVSGGGGFFLTAPGRATFTLTGFQAGSFNESVLAVAITDYKGAVYAGFSTESGHQILATGSPSFHDYALTTLPAPVSGVASLPLPGDSFGTSLGSLVITSAGGPSSFSTPGPPGSVPEPASVSLVAIGMLAAGGWAWPWRCFAAMARIRYLNEVHAIMLSRRSE